MDTRNWIGNQLQAYYGIFSGDFNNCYDPVKSITILTLEEAMAIKHAMEVEEYEKLYSKQPIKRLPTIEEVTKWFEENRIFKTKNEFIFRILGVAIKATFPIELNRDHYTIEEFCTNFTDQNGNELYITE